MGILDFVKDLPMGFDTIMASGGENFSGGQRQRIAIVTALLRYPRILVLDEATSALDTATERQVTELIAQYQCTKVVVAHRLSTVRNAENIVVMEDGRIIQSGRHDDLMMVRGVTGSFILKRNRAARRGTFGHSGPPRRFLATASAWECSPRSSRLCWMRGARGRSVRVFQWHW